MLPKDNEADLEDLPEMTIDFKRATYAELRDAFRDLVDRLRADRL